MKVDDFNVSINIKNCMLGGDLFLELWFSSCWWGGGRILEMLSQCVIADYIFVGYAHIEAE